MKKFIAASTALLSALCYMATTAQAAPNLYFDVNGAGTGYGVVNGGSYSWDDLNWGALGGGSATGNWVAGDFARFDGTANYTVTVNADESMAGLYQNVAGQTLTINSAGAGTLDIVPPDQGFITVGTTIINAVVSGTGGLAPESGGNLYLTGNNTYSGGTTFGYAPSSGTPLVYFNNNNSFGTGTIKFIQPAGTLAPMLAYGGTTITLPNAFQNTVSGAGVNFASSVNTPVVATGAWNLDAKNTIIKNNGDNTAPLTLSGNISSTANVTFSGDNGGKTILSGANTLFTGVTTVGSASSANLTLALGAANTLSHNSGVVMNGGNLDLGGFHHTMGATTLTLSASSSMDFEGNATLSLANSSSKTWTGTLDLLNYVSGELTVGSNASGLTSGQVADLLDGGVAGELAINNLGQIVVVPEPSTIALGVLGALGIVGRRFAGRKQA